MDVDGLARENAALKERVAALCAAALHITATLDVNTVLQEVVESARSLSGARWGVIATFGGAGPPLDYVAAGLTPEELLRLRQLPDGVRIFQHLCNLPDPLRADDMTAYMRDVGLPDAPQLSGPMLVVPMRHRGVLVGGFLLAEKHGAVGFTDSDEELLVLFGAQAAAAVANARAHRNEQRARADLEALVETSPVGVVVFDARTGIPKSFNGEAARIVESLRIPGVPLERLPDTIVCRRADGREIVFAEFPIAASLGSGETVRAEEIVLALPDGRSVTALVNSTPIHAEDGTVASVVVTMQDLAPLQEMERQRAEFLSLVSHELRAPLSAIKGAAATVLGSGPQDPIEMREFFRIVDEQADHMRALIADLLDAGRVETGTLSVAAEPTGVADLVDRARKTFMNAGGRHALQIDLPPDIPAVMADRGRILQVLNNLLANAARHSPASSTLRVAAALEGALVAITVSDEGVGLPPDGLAQLFRKHAPAPDAGPKGGTGLGLVICKGLVEAHGGRIRAESAGVGQGTRVTFTLPAVEDHPAIATAPAMANAAQRAPQGERILVADDDPNALRLVRSALTDAGYTPIATADPGEIERLVRTERPHLVLLDLLFPGADGNELMARIPNLSDVPVIFISAYARDETIARALEAGAADYLVKPFSATELIARIRAALRLRLEPEPFRCRDLAIYYSERRATMAGKPLALTAKEFEILRVLSENAGRVATYDALRRQVWDGRGHAQPPLVRTFVKKLRYKLGDNPRQPVYIKNERGVGYRMPRHDEAGTEVRGGSNGLSPSDLGNA
ncbi:MAG: response regulator [Gammaproteobacteria bacterium]|nr:response regulator [Gammaproteobacteria bacterium]